VRIAQNLATGPIHLAVDATVNMQIGMIHPPVGLNIFFASHIAKLGLTEVSLVSLPWICVRLVYLMLVTYVPAVSL
jgi:C4-dicarboxylate transporter DctM subunit